MRLRRTPRRRAEDQRGQALTEYVLTVGMVVLIVVAAVTIMIWPIGWAFVKLARATVIRLTS